MNKPLVSVIIPTYKQSGLLCKTIDTVLAQTYKNYEIIVVDDNNPDTPERKSTEDAMSHYADNPLITYLQHEVNKNGSAARNTGFKASKGEYIAFLDDDDYWLPEKLEKQVVYLEEHKEFDSVYCFLYVKSGKNPNRSMTGNIVIPYFMNYVSLQTSSLLFTRKAIETLKGFDESFRRHQDYETIVRFFLAGYKMGCIPEYLSGKGGIGGNVVRGEKLNDLKSQFFSAFEAPLNVLDKEHPGIKKQIIVANYVKNFESFMAGHRYDLAWGVFKKYFPMAPITFVKQVVLLFTNHIKRRS